MADFDSDVRSALRAAVPPDLAVDPAALIDGAVRTARRTRALRTAGAGLAGVATAAVLVATIGLPGLHRQAPEPAGPSPDPVVTQLCRDPQPTTPPSVPTEGLTGDAAAVCPAGAVPDGEPGWLLPGAALRLQRSVTYLRAGLASRPTGACPQGTAGQPFVVVVQRVDGRRTAYRSSDLACGGREAVARYLTALAYDRAAHDAAGTSGYQLECSPPDLTQVTGSVAPLDAVRAAHTSGLLCTYPVYAPHEPGLLQARDYSSHPLTAEQVSALNRALATATFTATAPARCTPSSRELLLRLTTPGAHTPAGEHVELVGGCPSVLRLNGYALWWQPRPEEQALLARLVPAD